MFLGLFVDSRDEFLQTGVDPVDLAAGDPDGAGLDQTALLATVHHDQQRGDDSGRVAFVQAEEQLQILDGVDAVKHGAQRVLRRCFELFGQLGEHVNGQGRHGDRGRLCGQQNVPGQRVGVAAGGVGEDVAAHT